MKFVCRSHRVSATTALFSSSNSLVVFIDKQIFLIHRCVLLELDESIFLKIYGPEWESGENLSNILIVTLADYFQVELLFVLFVAVFFLFFFCLMRVIEEVCSVCSP